MTTDTPAPTGARPLDEAVTTTVADLQRTRYLRRLLATREVLAKTYRERFGHELPDVLLALDALAACEDAIEREFPEVHARLYSTWCVNLGEGAHEPGEYDPACGICRARAPQHLDAA